MKHKIFIKKIVSLNPNKHEYKKLEDLIELYSFYIAKVTKNYTNGKTPKGFDEWIETEI